MSIFVVIFFNCFIVPLDGNSKLFNMLHETMTKGIKKKNKKK